jgi:hypothetical protein
VIGHCAHGLQQRAHRVFRRGAPFGKAEQRADRLMGDALQPLHVARHQVAPGGDVQKHAVAVASQVADDGAAAGGVLPARQHRGRHAAAFQPLVKHVRRHRHQFRNPLDAAAMPAQGELFVLFEGPAQCAGRRG